VSQTAALGRRHLGYGVTDDQYELVGAALLWTLEQHSASAFTREVGEAWSEAYLMVATVMRRSAGPDLDGWDSQPRRFQDRGLTLPKSSASSH
jgi:hypothetical protein